MTESTLVPVFCEGDADRAVLNALFQADLLPKRLDILSKHEVYEGREGMLRALAPFVRTRDGAGKRAIALADLDRGSVSDLSNWFVKKLSVNGVTVEQAEDVKKLASGGSNLLAYRFTGETPGVRVVLIAVGLSRDPELVQVFGLEAFTMDDYMLRLVMDRPVYEQDKVLKHVPFEKTREKVAKLVSDLRANAIPVEDSKRILHLFRAIVGYRSSPATFAGEIIVDAFRGGQKDRVRDFFQPLIDDIAAAEMLILG